MRGIKVAPQFLKENFLDWWISIDRPLLQRNRQEMICQVLSKWFCQGFATDAVSLQRGIKYFE